MGQPLGSCSMVDLKVSGESGSCKVAVGQNSVLEK